jgi:pimeloyl-ACP methyl ester carboxylesterase
MREQRSDIGSVELNYAEGPANGSPLVILHGGAASWRYAEKLIDLLKNSWHIFAPDLRGHGQSGHVSGRYYLADYVEDVAAFLSKVVSEPAVVYGHSLGGEIAVTAAAFHPDLVRAVIVGDAPLSNENRRTEEPAHRAMNELWLDLAGRSEEEIAMALREMPLAQPGTDRFVPAKDVFGEENPWFEFQALNLHRLDPGVLEAAMEGPEIMLEGYVPEELLPRISCPLLLLQADPASGGMLSDREVKAALQLLPRPSHVRLNGIGHELHGSSPELVFDAINTFLETI